MNPRNFRSTVFKTAALSHSAIPPKLADLFQTTHIRPEHVRNNDGPILLLIVLENCHQRTSDSQTGAVQGMDEFRLGLLALPKTDVGPTGLEIFKIAAGGDFPVGFLSRQPDLDIVCPGCRETHITGAELYNPVGKFQLAQHLFGISQKAFLLLI